MWKLGKWANKSKDGQMLKSEVERNNRWAQHFQEAISRPSLTSAPEFHGTREPDQLDTNTGPTEMSEVQKTTKGWEMIRPQQKC